MWATLGSDDSLPQPRPERVLPAEVPIGAVLAWVAKAVVAFGSVRSYPDGFDFVITALLREPLHHTRANGLFPVNRARRVGAPALREPALA